MEDITLWKTRFVECEHTGAAYAKLLAELRSTSDKGTFCLLALSKEAEALLDIDVVRAWPTESLDDYVTFVAAMPYQPDPAHMPCGRRENLIARCLEDKTFSKEKRIILWRAFAMTGFRFPRYSAGSWEVSEALLDHTSVREFICRRHLEGWRDLRNSDPNCFEKMEVPSFDSELEESAWKAIEGDSPAGLLLPLALMGQELPENYFMEVLRKKAAKTLVYLITEGQAFHFISSRELLFYLCANWNNDEAIPIVSLLEKLEPGLVASSLDCYGHNALWYTLFQRDNRGRATAAARRKMDPLDVTLINLGCNPAKECHLGLSWQDVTESNEVVEGVWTHLWRKTPSVKEDR